MHDIYLIGIASGVFASAALGKAVWHTIKLETHRRSVADRRDRQG